MLVDVLVVLTLVLATGVHARRLGWRLAVASVCLHAMTLQLYVVCLTPLLPTRFAHANAVVWGMAAVVYAVVALRWGIARVDRAQAVVVAAAGAVPAGGFAAYALYRLLAPNGGVIGWALVFGGRWQPSADSGSNASLAMTALADDGLLARRGSTVPLTTVLDLAWLSPRLDRLTTASRGAVYWDVLVGSQEVQILATLLLSLLLGLVALPAARSVRSVRRAAPAAVVVALLPWTWFVLTWGLWQGMQNVVVTLVVLTLCWIARSDLGAHPAAVVAALVAGTTLMASLWAPLAAVPLAWLLVAVVVAGRSGRLREARVWPWPAATAITAATYAVLYVWPALGASQGVSALANTGGTAPLSPDRAAACVLFLVLAAVLLRRLDSSTMVGVLTTLVPVVAVEVLLVATQPRELRWNYYPAKLAWLALAFLVLVTAAAGARAITARLATAYPGRPVGWLGLTGPVLALAWMVWAMPPWALPGHPSRQPFTPIALTAYREYDASVALLREALAADHPVLVVGLSGPRYPNGDALVDYFAIRAQMRWSEGPEKDIAWQLVDAIDGPVCRMLDRWGAQAEVWATSESRVDQLRSACPGRAFRTRIVAGLA